MTFSTMILLVAGRRISFKDRILIQEGFHHASPKDFKSLIKGIFYYTLCIELFGALFLFLYWQKKLSLTKGIFYSVFHSISAFCNAGFALFSDNFESFRDSIWMNAVILFLVILGGMGFLVLQEIRDVFSRFKKRKKVQISLHAKLVLFLTLFFIVFSWIVFILIEWNNSLQDLTVKEKILSSLFQVITPRTAGFNTMNLNTLSFASLLLLISLMFIGASPGSTGGGVKTNTIGVIFAFLRSKITARESVNLFYRTLPLELITRAFMVITMSICVVFASSFVLFLTEAGASMAEVLFEVFSAFGTVGLSLGLTPKLSALGKIVIIITMYIGRIGPLTLLYAFSRQRAFGKYVYVEETVMIG